MVCCKSECIDKTRETCERELVKQDKAHTQCRCSIRHGNGIDECNNARQRTALRTHFGGRLHAPVAIIHVQLGYILRESCTLIHQSN